MKLLERIFGPKGTNEKLLVQHPDGVPISLKEAKALEIGHGKELEKLAPLQKRLKEETALLKEVVQRKLTKSERKEVLELLASGEDPLLLASYLKVPFKEVAILANDVLKMAHGHNAPRIPTDVVEYIALAKEFEKQNAAKAPAATPIVLEKK